MKKRGQVTAFIIAGIIIVVLALLVVYYKDKIVASNWERERLKAMVVPDEAEEINKYIYDCISEVSEDGVTLLGLQGGYIELPPDYISESAANPFSTSLNIFPGSDWRTAYWFYELANKVQKNGVPTITLMQEQLSNYVSTNLKECVGNFEQFKDLGVTAEDAIVKTEIKDEGVFFSINYPINIKLGDFEFDFKNFYHNVDAGLGKLYKIGKRVMEAENKDFFLEDLTIDMLVLYDELPYSDIDFKCDTKIWTKTKVLEELKKILSTNIQFVKIKGTDYNLISDDYSYFEWGAPIGSRKDVKAMLRYSQGWPVKMEVHPSKGELLQGDQLTKEVGGPAMAFLTSFFCLNNYHFIYDIKYPVLITLTDSKTGYIFQFATQVIIDNNQPRINRIEAYDWPESKKELCKKGMTETTVYALKINPDETLTPVEDARISFKCITTICDMGETKMGETGEIALTKKFPQCINGLLTAEKIGHHKGQTFTSTNEEATVSVLLEPHYLKLFDIKVIDQGMARNPQSNEQIIFQFEEKDKGYTTSIIWPAEQQRIQLIAGNYHVKSHIIKESTFGIVIQGKKVESCPETPMKSIFGIFMPGESECVETEIPPTTLEQVVIGGAEFDWELPRQSLADATRITFYTVADKTPSTYDELATVYERIEDRTNLKLPEIT